MTDLLKNAFVHRSYLNESSEFSESNERLEYLGDAVLELATSDYLYKKFPDYQEGMLTNIRAALVRTESLAEVARQLNFSDKLLMSKGEEATGGRSNPSILADAFEAYLGALYLTKGFGECVTFLEQNLFTQTGNIIQNGAYKDNKSLLQEVSQSRYKATPIYKLIEESGPDHDKHFVMQVEIGNTLYAKGEGKSKQSAQESAAKNTLEVITNS